jgi:hypothetical protein
MMMVSAMRERSVVGGLTLLSEFLPALLMGWGILLIDLLCTANLPAHFMVWAASNEAKFLNGKTVWANWDVEELKAERDSIVGSGKFTLGLLYGDKTHGDGLDNGHGLRLSWFWSWKPFGSRFLNYCMSRVWIGKRLGSRLLN